MRTRTARTWAVLTGLAAACWATADGSGLALAGAGMLCVALALAVMCLDSQRKRGGTRR